MFTREKRSVAQHLSQDAAYGPDIDGLCVALGVQHDFWGAVPSCGHILCQETCVVVVRVGNASKAKITDLQRQFQKRLKQLIIIEGTIFTKLVLLTIYMGHIETFIQCTQSKFAKIHHQGECGLYICLQSEGLYLANTP